LSVRQITVSFGLLREFHGNKPLKINRNKNARIKDPGTLLQGRHRGLSWTAGEGTPESPAGRLHPANGPAGSHGHDRRAGHGAARRGWLPATAGDAAAGQASVPVPTGHPPGGRATRSGGAGGPSGHALPDARPAAVPCDDPSLPARPGENPRSSACAWPAAPDG